MQAGREPLRDGDRAEAEAAAAFGDHDAVDGETGPVVGAEEELIGVVPVDMYQTPGHRALKKRRGPCGTGMNVRSTLAAVDTVDARSPERGMDAAGEAWRRPQRDAERQPGQAGNERHQGTPSEQRLPAASHSLLPLNWSASSANSTLKLVSEP